VRLTGASTIGRAGLPLPWGDLVRRVDGVDGQVGMHWAVHPGTGFGTAQPWLSNDLGLMAEQMEPESRELRGNVPQGLSHLAVVNAAFAIARATQRAR
jgi:hypothetical protein